MATPPRKPGISGSPSLGAFTRNFKDTFEANAANPRPATPRWVVAAARLMLIAAVIQVVSSVVAVIHAASPEQIPAIQQQIDAMTGTAPSVTSMQNMNVITVGLAGLATICVYVAFAFFLNKGHSWARVVAGLWMILTLVQLVGLTFPSGWTTIAQLVLGGGAVGLCYLPASSAYFAAIKAGSK